MSGRSRFPHELSPSAAVLFSLDEHRAYLLQPFLEAAKDSHLNLKVLQFSLTVTTQLKRHIQLDVWMCLPSFFFAPPQERRRSGRKILSLLFLSDGTWLVKLEIQQEEQQELFQHISADTNFHLVR